MNFINYVYLINLITVSICIGSFLNVVIYRLPLYGPGFNLNTPRSHCPICKHPLSWYENIPLISWCVLLGKCKNCKTKISIRYPLFEMGTGILMSMPAIVFGINIVTLLIGLVLVGFIPPIVWSVKKQLFNRQMYMWHIGTVILLIISITGLL